MSQLCQSCEINSPQIIESCDYEEFPYCLCKECHFRLLSRALRPLEWFNLAKKFGPAQFLLHDDFYSDDGEALQAEAEVKDSPKFPAPLLRDVSKDAELLLDYSVTRWFISDDLLAHWSSLSPSIVHSVLLNRFDTTFSSHARNHILKIAAATLKSGAADIVKLGWDKKAELGGLHSLIRASAACLPYSEAWDLSVKELDSMSVKKQRGHAVTLGYFQSPDALNWIERQISEPVVDNWGVLASVSSLSWERVVDWLRIGRPLSLVAIDALSEIVDPHSPIARDLSPALLGPPTETEFKTELNSYAQKENVPRVQQRVAYLMRNIKKLIR